MGGKLQTLTLSPSIGTKQSSIAICIIIIIIIIITNEKIQVMLSRKRCMGTLQDYNKGEISECQSKLWTNRNVFSWWLNFEEMVVDCSMHAVQRRGKHDVWNKSRQQCFT